MEVHAILMNNNFEKENCSMHMGSLCFKKYIQKTFKITKFDHIGHHCQKQLMRLAITHEERLPSFASARLSCQECDCYRWEHIINRDINKI